MAQRSATTFVMSQRVYLWLQFVMDGGHNIINDRNPWESVEYISKPQGSATHQYYFTWTFEPCNNDLTYILYNCKYNIMTTPWKYSYQYTWTEILNSATLQVLCSS